MARRVTARLRGVLRTDASSVRQSLAALGVSSAGSLLAGLTLGSITGTLEALPGLLVLVPAAIGMRGNIFGALASRLGTAIHAGTFRMSRRTDTLVGQNVLASLALTCFISLALAVLAKTVAVAFGVAGTISVVDFVVVSVVGGVLSSVPVLVVTLGVASGSARFGWDLDNVAAPLVTAAGDVFTLPALFLATYLVGLPVLSPAVAVLAVFLGVGALAKALRSGRDMLIRIVRESVPVLLVAGLVDVVAGLTIQKSLSSFLRFPGLLVLVPPFLEVAGALGGILASRLSSKLHLGLVRPANLPDRASRDDFWLIGVYAVPVFVAVALSSELASSITDLSTPGAARMVAISLIGGAVATSAVVGVAYYGAVAAFRLGLDPDIHGIPLITSSMDLIGAMALILAIIALGAA
ncbi:MAG: magnesium transporter [Acidimicrobiales bacterium]